MPFLQETFPVSGFDSCLPGYVTGQMNAGMRSEQLLKFYINMKKGEGREWRRKRAESADSSRSSVKQS